MSVDFALLSFFISFLTLYFIVRYFYKNEQKLSILADNVEGVQKFHDKPTPRVGGLGIFISVAIAFIFLYFRTKDERVLYFLIAALPAFLSGLAEDITKKIGVSTRLFMTIFSALIGVFLLSAIVHRVDIGFIDNLLKINIIAILFTIIAVGGVANSFNIIDGYNGLSSAVSILILIGELYVSYKVHDSLLVLSCFILIGAVLGFFIWNYPYVKIFLGDGGAYFIGFCIAEMSVLLIIRHQNVSAWFPLLLVIYPVFETLFSIYRRKFIRKVDRIGVVSQQTVEIRPL